MVDQSAKLPKKRIENNVAGMLSAVCFLAMVVSVYLSAAPWASLAGFLLGVLTAALFAFAAYRNEFSSGFFGVLSTVALAYVLVTQPGILNTAVATASGILFILFSMVFRGKIPPLDSVFRRGVRKLSELNR
jgi:O-antigen/teichoic acid export membrane protein